MVCTSPYQFWEEMDVGTPVLLQRSALTRETVIESIRLIGDRPLLKFKGIDSITEAYGYIGCDLYCDQIPVIQEEEDAGLDISGYSLVDQHGSTVGVVEQILERTMQPLLQVRMGERECLVPWVEEWVIDLDDENKQLVMSLPEGLTDIN